MFQAKGGRVLPMKSARILRSFYLHLGKVQQLYRQINLRSFHSNHEYQHHGRELHALEYAHDQTPQAFQLGESLVEAQGPKDQQFASFGCLQLVRHFDE